MALKDWFNQSQYRLWDRFKKRIPPLEWDNLSEQEREQLKELTEYKLYLDSIIVRRWESCKTLEDVEIEANLIHNIVELTLFSKIIKVEGSKQLLRDRANLLGAIDFLTD